MKQHFMYVGLGAVGVRLSTVLAEVETDAIGRFGGYTHTLAKGGWKSGMGEIMQETVMVWDIVTFDDDPGIMSFVVRLKESFGQQAVLLVSRDVQTVFV